MLFFFFGFMNPDSKDCYYYPGVKLPERDPLVLKTTALEMGLKELKGYPVNMGHVYRIWFMWGFFSMIGSLFLALCLKYLKPYLGNFKNPSLIFFTFTLVLNSVAWLALGIVWRFANSGLIVSGDKLEKTDVHRKDNDLWKAHLHEEQY